MSQFGAFSIGPEDLPKSFLDRVLSAIDLLRPNTWGLDSSKASRLSGKAEAIDPRTLAGFDRMLEVRASCRLSKISSSSVFRLLLAVDARAGEYETNRNSAAATNNKQKKGGGNVNSHFE